MYDTRTAAVELAVTLGTPDRLADIEAALVRAHEAGRRAQDDPAPPGPAPERPPLSERQRDCLAYICEHIEREQVPPTLREIGAAMGISSTNGVADHMRALVRKGYIARTPLASRAIRVL